MTPPCPKCEQFDGLWQWLDDGGLGRCNCPRGLELAALDAKRNDLRKAKLEKAAVKRTQKIAASRDRSRRMRAAGQKLERKYRELPLVDENRYGKDE